MILFLSVLTMGLWLVWLLARILFILFVICVAHCLLLLLLAVPVGFLQVLFDVRCTKIVFDDYFNFVFLMGGIMSPRPRDMNRHLPENSTDTDTDSPRRRTNNHYSSHAGSLAKEESVAIVKDIAGTVVLFDCLMTTATTEHDSPRKKTTMLNEPEMIQVMTLVLDFQFDGLKEYHDRQTAQLKRKVAKLDLYREKQRRARQGHDDLMQRFRTGTRSFFFGELIDEPDLTPLLNSYTELCRKEFKTARRLLFRNLPPRHILPDICRYSQLLDTAIHRADKRKTTPTTAAATLLTLRRQVNEALVRQEETAKAVRELHLEVLGTTENGWVYFHHRDQGNRRGANGDDPVNNNNNN